MTWNPGQALGVASEFVFGATEAPRESSFASGNSARLSPVHVLFCRAMISTWRDRGVFFSLKSKVSFLEELRVRLAS